MKMEDMRKQRNKLKLRLDEVVYCDSFELACKCCELAHKLGMMWADGRCYTKYISYPTEGLGIYYNFHKGVHTTGTWICEEPICATEWLNRHGIFVYGQEVLVSDRKNCLDVSRDKRFYIGKSVVVAELHETDFLNKKPFITSSWKYIYSLFPKWIDEEPDTTITLADGTKVELSQESYDKLKKAVR